MELTEISKKLVVTATQDTGLEDAARLMRERHVGDLVVIEIRQADGRKIPVGILTDRDIVMATVALGVSPSALSVGDVMTRNVVTAKESDSVRHVINLMKANGIKRIPILGDTHDLVGIVALEDILSLMAEEFFSVAQVSRREKEQEYDRRRKFA